MNLLLHDEKFELLPEKALYWPQERVLTLSDLHLGKAESIQAAGVPVPSGTHQVDLRVLERVLEKYPTDHVIILGDLVHNRNSWSSEIYNDIRNFLLQYQEIHWTLIYGNHEKGSLEKLRTLPFHLQQNDIQIGTFLFSHGHHRSSSKYFEIQGHVHPQVKLRQGPLQMTLPCFHLQENQLTLPAFGSWTGGYTIRPKKGDRLFAIAQDHIFEVRDAI
ncbi:ligase-associated DNA damage response endonuclease PdeM [Bdellovibrio sp. HCB2-146]|uniref:ligase-associated DNA damage response endonuclease PdeM n=1 Tax=Bdellovibrio sp. HCB2-146 TaxID=3394362 RepID=UPI0039BC323D